MTYGKQVNWYKFKNIFFYIDQTDTAIWFTNAMWTADHKLLQEFKFNLKQSNLTVRRPYRVPIMSYIKFNKRRHLVNKGLVNLKGVNGI